MESKWKSLKPEAVALRQDGNSIKSIKDRLGIPLSTLSGWFKDIQLTPEHREKIDNSANLRLAKSREKAAITNKKLKLERIVVAHEEAKRTLDQLPETDMNVLEIALAMLYLGEGAKGENTSLASSDPRIAEFYVNCLRKLYKIPDEKIKAYLHLRADQNENLLKAYWAKVLNISISNFGKTSYDKRTIGRPSYEDYKGVCQIECGRVEIQRRLMYIANGYCDRFTGLDESAISSFG